MRKFGKESTAPAEGVSRDSGNGRLQNRCALWVGLIVVVALLLRTVFAYGFSADGGFALSGGSQAQYHLHVVESILSGSFVIGTDAAINYPIGGLNVIPPLYDFIAAALGAAISPSASLAVLAPIFGALTVIPVFLIGKELYSEKAGLASALIFACLALPVSSSIFSNGTEYAFAAFLVGFFILEMIKVVKGMAADGADKKDLIIAGLILGIIALTWNGFRALVVLLIIMMVIQMFIDRFNSKNVTGALVSYSLIMLIGVVIAALYYIPAGLWDAVFSGTVLITIVAIVFGAIFMGLQSKPWIIVAPALIVAFILLSVVLYFVAPDYCTAMIFGNSTYANQVIAGLTVGNTISRMAAYFGWITLWLPIVLGMYELYLYARKDRSPLQLFMAMWLIIIWIFTWSSYGNAAVLAVVIGVGSGAFIMMVLEKADLKTWVANIKAAGFPGCFRKLIKPLPFISVLVLVFLVVAPNVSYGIDAGIPSNDDNKYYFTGNTNAVIETGDAYPYSYIWEDFSAIEGKDGIVTWIDYASGAVAKGGFKAIDDMNGNGTSAAAQIYLSNGGAGATAASLVRLMMATDENLSGAFPSADVYKTVKGFIEDPKSAIVLVLSDKAKFGSVRSDISGENAIYLAAVDYILSNMSTSEIMKTYEDVEDMTATGITYYAVDGSMVSLSYNDGSILSTMAYIAGYTTDSYGIATQFFTCPYIQYGYATGYGTDALYKTFLWKALIGPSPAQAGYETSLDYLYALASSTGDVKPMPGYGLAGFDVADWIVKYNPKTTATASDDGWTYMDYFDAIDLQETDGGVINYLASIIVLMYHGSHDGDAVGELVDTAGNGIAGATVQVSCYDNLYGSSWIYSETKTMADGSFAVPVPFGTPYKLLFSNDGVNLEVSEGGASFVVSPASFYGTVVVGEAPYDGSFVYTLTKNGVSYTIQSEGAYFDSSKAADASGKKVSIAPGVYEYSLSDSKATVLASGSVTLYPGYNSGLVVSLKECKLTVNVNDPIGQKVNGGNVYALDTETGALFSAPVVDGVATMSVVAGKYNIDVYNGYVSSTTTTQNITSSRTTTITAYLSKTVSIDGPSDVQFAISSESFSKAVYDGVVEIPISLAQDRVLYTVYGADATSVYLGIINEDTSSVSVTASKACCVSGDIGVAGTVKFINANGAMITASAGATGEFSILVPAGSYTVHITDGKSVYIGTANVSGDMELDDVTLVGGKTITGTLKHASATSKGSLAQPYVYAEVAFTYNGKSMSLAGMSDSSGKISFVIPAEATSVSVNFNGGSIDNGAVKCSNLYKAFEDGTTDCSESFTISKEETNSVTIHSPYKMTLTPYSGGDDIEVSGTVTLAPGQYDAEIKSSTGYVFDGRIYVYPGVDGFIGLNPTPVYEVEIIKGDLDVLTITGEKSYDNPEDDNVYYFEYDCEYFLETSNGSTGMVKYGYIDGPVSSIDMRTSALLMTITGNVGVIGDGSLTITYDDVKIVEEIKSGAFKFTVPENVKSAVLDAEVTATVSNQTYGFSGSVNTSLSADAIINIPVYNDATVVNHDGKFDAEIVDASFGDGIGTVKVKVYNNYEFGKTYVITAGPAWTLNTARVYVDAGSSEEITVTGSYDSNALGIGSKGLTVIVSDFNGTDTKTIPVVDGTVSEKSQLVTMTAGSESGKLDKLSGAEYLYALVFNNVGPEASVKINVTGINGYELSLMNADGSVIKENGSSMVIPVKSKTVVYVKVMKFVGEMTSVPNITVSSDANGGVITLAPSTIDIELESMEVSGDNVYDKAKGIPMGVWFLAGICVLLLVLGTWMSNKRRGY